MDSNLKDLPAENSEISQLEKEIAELELTTKRIGMEGLSTLGKACFPIVLTWIFALGIWLLPRPTPIGILIPLYIIGIIGVVLSRFRGMMNTPQLAAPFLGGSPHGASPLDFVL